MIAADGLARIFRFGIVGLLAAGTYAVVVLLLVDGFAMRPHMASVWGYLAGIPVSFFGQKHFTFRSKRRASAEIGPFLLVQLVNIAASYGLMYATTEIFHLNPKFGILAVIVGTAAIAYVLLRFFVFFIGTPPAEKGD